MLPPVCRTLAVFAAIFCISASALAQESTGPAPRLHVDAHGAMRWSDSEKEPALFGVNYTTPFAFAYRGHGYVGADRKRSIDVDVTHLARLGLDAFRIHVWDREITDRNGNLLQNDHLDLLDYLLARLAERRIWAILTPIAYWPPGYPEPAPKTSGISDYFTKAEMITDPDALRAQENYMRQFAAHVNPYTGFAYGDDPNVIAFELWNEPSHSGGPQETTRFINALAQALREGGFSKPIFYNISVGYSAAHGRAVCGANIQGVTSQWYPTGLVRGASLRGNMLPNVDRYSVPFADFPECRDKAHMVYEFDAADVTGSYMYPAMARAFREAGIQWATQFAYDPLAIAHTNTEYQTHFLNLVYTPEKAVSFMIAGEVFRRTPRGASHGAYPMNERFGSFRVSYEDNLSEMVTDTAFYYSSSTATKPPDAALLRHVAGTGTSPVASYSGRGAYFLDRLEDGIWQLEVYPDAVPAADPFSRPSLERHAVHIVWTAWPMEIALPNLGTDFTVEPIDDGNTHRPAARGGSFDVRPGTYLLRRSDAMQSAPASYRQVTFFAPPPSVQSALVIHRPPTEIPAGMPFVVRAQVFADDRIDSAAVFVRRAGGFNRFRKVPMTASGGHRYAADLPPELLRPGMLEYAITAFGGTGVYTYPDGAIGHPGEWDFTGQRFWEVPVVAAETPLVLFDARRDRDHILVPHPWKYVAFRIGFVGATMPDRLALQAIVDDFAPAPHHFAIRSILPEGAGRRLPETGSEAELRITGRTTGRKSGKLVVALVEASGMAWGAEIALTDAWRDIAVPLSSLRRVPLVLLPRPFPEYLPYMLESAGEYAALNLAQLEGLQYSMDGDPAVAADESVPQGFEIERVTLDRN